MLHCSGTVNQDPHFTALEQGTICVVSSLIDMLIFNQASHRDFAPSTAAYPPSVRRFHCRCGLLLADGRPIRQYCRFGAQASAAAAPGTIGHPPAPAC